jgi:hypothetical protein
MKKIIALSLLALTLGTNVPSTANGMFLIYPFKKTYEATKHAAKATTEAAKATLSIAIIVAASIAFTCGVDAALAWATKIGLPATFFDCYKFGTFSQKVYGWLAPTTSFSDSLIEKAEKLPEILKKYLVHKKSCHCIGISSDSWCFGFTSGSCPSVEL